MAKPSSAVCRHCNIDFRSRNALFRHLESVGIEANIRPQGKKTKRPTANIAFQLGYYWLKEATNDENALDQVLGSRLEGIDILWRIGAPSGNQGIHGRAPGSSAWCDVVCAFDSKNKAVTDSEWIQGANRELISRGHAIGLHLRILRVVKIAAALTAEAIAWSRVEIAVPSSILSNSPMKENSQDIVRSLRDTANKVLCKGEKLSWHSFGDRIPGHRPPCPGDDICRYALRRIDCSQNDHTYIRVAITAEGLQLRLAASRAVALAVAVHCRWLSLEESRAAFAEDTLWFALAPRPPSSAEMLASISFGCREVKANACVDALRNGPSPTVETFRNEVRNTVNLDDCILFWKRFKEWCLADSVQTQRLVSEGALSRPLKPQVIQAYTDTLNILRRLRQDGWPATTPARAARIQERSPLVGGGSFSVGATPQSQSAPKNNTLSELVTAVFALEKMLSIDSPRGYQPATMCAVNCDALFLPHVDTGSTGDGQSISLFVALGDFSGGDLIVEGIAHDCRYKPLFFDACTNRHWTASFQGERFSLVWFTPKESPLPSSSMTIHELTKTEEAPLTLYSTFLAYKEKNSAQLKRRCKRFAFACSVNNEDYQAGFLNPRPGVTVCRGLVAPEQAIELLRMLDSLKLNFLKPRYTNGQNLRCRVACLGRCWNHESQSYEGEATPLPGLLLTLARRAALACAEVDASILGSTQNYTDPDVCILNFYDDAEHRAGMGLHQDIAEDPAVIARGDPVISVSIGATALFIIAEARDTKPNERIRLRLESGDALAFGGSGRLLFHGVEHVAPFFQKEGAKKLPSGMCPGRLNLTFRTSKL